MAARFFIRFFFLTQIGLATVGEITYTCSPSVTCGCSLNSAVLTKIVGGEQARTNTWGWAVSIRVLNSHICGGTLLSSTLVLTAAHCLVSISSLSILSINVGSQYLSVIDQKRSISNFYIHPDYNTKTFVNDIAIMRLASPLDLNDRALAIICLPPSTVTTTSEYPAINSTLVAIGWGVLSSGSKTSSNTLQQVSLTAISSKAANCRNSIVDVSKQFCAGVNEGGKDTCQGDSGGPLMLFTNSRWQLVGITSYGTGCGLAAYAGVYTRVSAYTTWISCFLTNNNSSSCPFQTVAMRTSIGSNLLTFTAVHIFCLFLFFSTLFFAVI